MNTASQPPGKHVSTPRSDVGGHPHAGSAKIAVNSVTYGLRSISNSESAGLIVLGLLLSALFHVSANQGVFFYVGCAVAVGVGVSVAFVPLRHLVLPIAIMILLMPDLTQTSDQIQIIGQIQTASLWQLTIGPLSPAMFVMTILIIALVRLSRISTVRLFVLPFVFFFGVSVLASAFYGYLSESGSRFIADFKLAVFVYFSLVLFDAYFRRFPEETLRSAQLFLMLLVGSVLFQSIRYVFSSPAETFDSSYVNSSLDSAKGLILAITFYAMAKIGGRRNVLVWAGVALFSLFLLISYQTRWLILTFIVGFALALQVFPVSRQIKLAIFLGSALALGLLILIMAESEALRIMLLRFSFVQDIGRASELVDVELVRGGSIINSVNQLWERKALFTGMGYGSWYSDDYFPMPGANITAFDEESLRTGKFYRVHDFVFHFFFKFGLIGLAVYLWLFLKPLLKLWGHRRQIAKVHGGTELLIVLFGITPTVITYMWFTGKGNMFCGFFIALCISWSYILFNRTNECVLTRYPQTSANLQ